MPKRFSLLLLSMMVLTSCGPVMQASTSYTPPTSSEGMACIQQCEATATSCTLAATNACTQSAQQAYQQCQVQAQLAFAQCQMRGQQSCAAARCVYNGGNCSAFAAQQCTPSYDSCYRSCGGSTTMTTVCTRRCG